MSTTHERNRDYPMTSDSSLRAEAANHMANLLHIDPLTTRTQLAKYTAISLYHNEWLDDSEHWIWELALNAKDDL